MPSAIPANQEIDALHERIAALEFECADLRKRAEVPPDPRGGPSRAERAADAALLRSEAKYRAVLAALPDLIFRLDREGIFLEYHSPSAGDLYFPEEQFVGKPVGEVMPPEFAQRVVELVQQTLASDEQQLYAYEMTIDGALRHFEARFAVSGPDEVVAVVRNVTKRTRAEAELKAKENLLGAIVDSLPLWLAVKDREGRMLMVNRRMAEECGVSERDFVGLATMELPHSTPQEKARIVELDRRVMATGEPIDDPAVSVTLPGGEVRTVHSIITPLRDAQQNIAGVVTISEDVSGRIRAEHELREGAERYRRLVEESLQGILVVQDGTIVFVNRAEAEIFGYSAPQEMIGRRRNDHIAPHELKRLMGYLEAREAGEQAPSHYAFQGLKKDGTPIWVESVAQVTTWEGKPATQSLHIDITERKRAEQALRDSQERFTWIAEHSPVMLYRYDSRRGAIDRLEFSYISPHAVKLTGFTPEEIVGDPTLLTGRYHPEDQADWRERLEAVTREGKDWDQVLRYRRKDGEYIWIHTQTWRNYLPDGSVEGAGYWTDVTERKRAEAALAASEALLRGFLDNTPVRVYLKDREGKYLMINRHYEVSTGFRREQVLGKTARDLFPAETAAVYLAHDREVRRQRKALQFEETDPRADGVRTFLTQRFPLFDAQGEVEAVCGISTDITARKKAEQALAASEARIRNFTDSAPAFLAHVDSEGRYRFANAQYSKFFGLPEAEIVGSTIEELLGAEAYGMVRPHVEKALAGEEVAYEHALPLGDMGVRDLDVRYVPDRDDAGNVIGFYVAVLDITARKQAERRLRENERLLQAVFDALPIWVTVKDRELRHVMVNRRYAEDTGCTTERYPRIHALEVPYGTPEERERVHGYDIKVLETGEPVDIEELPITLGDGQQRIVRNINVPLRDDAGEVIGLVGISEDVTERKAVQRALEASERRLRMIVEQVPGVIYRRFGSTRGEDRFAFVSPHAEALTGYTPEEIYADPELMTGRYHPEDIPRLHAFHKKIEREEPKRGSYSVELRYRHKEGHYIWIRSNFKRTYQSDGAFEAVGVWMDITEQKQAEIALRLSEERFHQMAENIPGTVFEFVQRADGRYAMPYMNRNGIDYMGLSPEQADEMKNDAAVVFQHMHPDEVGSFRQALADSKRTLKPFDWEGRGQAATGEWRWLHGFAFPRDAGHGNTLWNGVILDTTRRKRAEEALRESEERFRGLAEGSLQGMLVHRDFEVLFCNGAAAEMFGYGSPERLLAAGSIAPHIAPHERERIERFASARLRGEAVTNRYEADYVRADGQPLTLEVLSQVIEWEERPAIQSTLVDITERK
ncbi:MAG: PAS domain S-box protein, partial [SAR324 cluster bacterium]|nr:PAS domain S-box protein [SAR324 cluster bacterium]